MKYKVCKPTCDLFGITGVTLRKWYTEGTINLSSNPDSKYVYDIEGMTGEPIPAKGYMATGGLMKATGLTRGKVYSWGKSGVLKSVLCGRNHYYNMDEIDMDWLKSMMNGTLLGDDDGVYLSARDAASSLSISVAAVFAWCRSGDIEAITIETGKKLYRVDNVTRSKRELVHQKCEATCRMFGIDDATLRTWAKNGTINLLDKPGDGEYCYDILAMTGQAIPVRGYLKTSELMKRTGLSRRLVGCYREIGVLPFFKRGRNYYYNVDGIDTIFLGSKGFSLG